jgi:hypothetical protein
VGKGRLREGALRPGGRCAPASTSGRCARWPRIPPRDSFSPTAPPLDAGRETSGDAPKRLCSEANDAGSTQDGPALLCPTRYLRRRRTTGRPQSSDVCNGPDQGVLQAGKCIGRRATQHDDDKGGGQAPFQGSGVCAHREVLTARLADDTTYRDIYV